MEETLISLFERRVNLSGSDAALRHVHKDAWRSSSWRSWWERSERLAAGLISLGVSPGDRVALLAKSREEWALLDVAILMARAVVVPLYPASTGARIRQIITHSGARHILAEDPVQVQKVLPLLEDSTPALQAAVFIEPACMGTPERSSSTTSSFSSLHIEDLPGATSLLKGGRLLDLDALMVRGRRLLAESPDIVTSRRLAIVPSDLATLVYTSGTTGQPLGVHLTHRQVLAEVEALHAMKLLDKHDVHLMALPLAHIFARVVLWAGVCSGFETAFSRGLKHLARDLQEVSPTIFAGVPHLFEQMQRRLLARLERFDSPAFRQLVELLLTQGVEISRQRQYMKGGGKPRGAARLMHALLEKTLYPQVKQSFGGRLRFFISGGAPLPVEVAEFFHACDVLILEGYGLTETCAAVTLNTPEGFRFGSVGRPLPGVDLTISPGGEVLVKGPMCTTRGYHHDPERTAMLLDEQGWLHTGDLGRFDRDGYLYITGRLKNLIITSGGKNIAPLSTEMALEASRLISRAVLFGDGRPYLTALITLDQEELERLGREASLHRVYLEEQEREGVMEESFVSWLTRREEILRVVQAHVDAVNEGLASFESVRKFAILDADFSLDAGELTPTLKLRRATVEARHKAVIDALYEGTHATNRASSQRN